MKAVPKPEMALRFLSNSLISDWILLVGTSSRTAAMRSTSYWVIFCCVVISSFRDVGTLCDRYKTDK